MVDVVRRCISPASSVVVVVVAAAAAVVAVVAAHDLAHVESHPGGAAVGTLVRGLDVAPAFAGSVEPYVVVLSTEADSQKRSDLFGEGPLRDPAWNSPTVGGSLPPVAG